MEAVSTKRLVHTRLIALQQGNSNVLLKAFLLLLLSLTKSFCPARLRAQNVGAGQDVIGQLI
jgi:hypothetical protein